MSTQDGYLAGGPVGFGEAVSQGWSNVFTYRGRASRSAYWWLYLLGILLGAVVALVIGATGATGHGKALFIGLASLVGGVLVLYQALALLAALVRRLHDTDRSGWWVLISLVPLVGGIWLLVLTVLPGTAGSNRFGP